MQQSLSSLDGGKVHGKYRRLSPFLDEDGMWRVGLRMREFTPFTWDNKPAAFLPSSSRLTLLLMTEAHEKKHSGVEETVAQFPMLGYWTTQAGKLAKSVKSKCIVCKYLDKPAMGQIMGSLPKTQLVEPIAWGQVEMDLFGPYKCRSEVNKRSSCKI